MPGDTNLEAQIEKLESEEIGWGLYRCLVESLESMSGMGWNGPDIPGRLHGCMVFRWR
jgi:hypothetical protein